MSKIRVWVADDHVIVRTGLHHIVNASDDLVIVGESEDGAGTLRAIQGNDFDLLLLDLSMPDGGVELISRIRDARPEIKILVLTMHAEPYFAARAIKAGVAGYITKDSKSDELLLAIHKVAGGGRYVTPSLAEVLLFEHLGEENSSIEVLSARELEVLEHLASGKSIGDIAKIFGTSDKTVRVQKTRMMRKLSLSTNADLYQYANKHGLARSPV